MDYLNTDWTSRRVGGVRLPDPPTEAKYMAPKIEEFASDRQFQIAMEVWLGKLYGAEDHTRVVKDPDSLKPKTQAQHGDVVGYDQLLPTNEERAAELRAFQARRLASGQADVSERLRAAPVDPRQADAVYKAYYATLDLLEQAGK